MKRYNIALLHYSCPPVVGGVEEIIHQQASVFQRYYHKTKIFVGSGGRLDDTFEVEINPLLGSRSERILAAHESIHKGENREMENLMAAIYGYLADSLEGFDILIAHNVLTMPYNLPLTGALHRIGRESLLPIISWNHDSPYFYSDYPGYLDLFPWNALKRSYGGINYVAISGSRKEMFADLYGSGKQLYVVPNGIDPVGFFQLDPITIQLIREKKLFESEFIMVQPSRLHPRKNMELSIRVTRALHDQGVKARLLITGAYDPHQAKSIDYYNSLVDLTIKEGVEDDVLIMAEHVFKSGEKISADRIIIRDLYLIADILFLPSLQEGFGIPLLESGMIKLPVVCSDIPPFVEIGGEDICVFNLEDSPETIARKIISFTDQLKPHNMFRKVMKDYTWDNIYNNKLMPLVEDIIGNRICGNGE